MAVGLASWSVCAWAQADGTHSAAASYREQLKAEASDQQQAKGSDADSRKAYEEHLRQLSKENDVAGARSTEAQAVNPPGVRAASAQASSSADSSDARSANESAGVQPVSMQAGTRSLSGIVLPPQASPGTDCSDAYCQELRRIANGGHPEVRLATYESGRTPTTEGNFIRNLAFDQVHIWESPFKLRDTDATWAVPFGIATGSLIATDRDVSRQVAKPAHIDTSKKISDLGLYSFIGAGAGFYGLGLISNDDHKRETGLLAGEAFINATLVGEALKGITGRQRPFEADHFGHIGKGGTSFPSEHAIGSWAIASVIAHEYPNPLIQFLSYGLASAVSITRITAGQHFPSDVLVGGTFGYLIGRKIYRDHHNPELGGSEYGTFVREHPRDAEHSGSAYVPLESWVYPVIDRLAGLGYIHSNFDSERPFTRLECARLAAEAAENTNGDDTPASVNAMVAELQREFARESEVWAGNSENRSAVLESVYTRATEISGPVLRDGYHFGQTLYNDYGRPYGRGFNDVTGFSARATSGPLVFYFRGEYQHAPGNPNYTPEQKAMIAVPDFQAPVLDNQFPAMDRFKVLDAYLGVNFSNIQLTLGQQSLWWGQGEAGPFLFSDNATPLNMVRLNRTSPFKLPGVFGLLGPTRFDAFIGQIAGSYLVFHRSATNFNGFFDGPNLHTGPFIQAQRITFKPTENLELGLTHVSTFGGDGFPLTWKTFVDATFSTGNTISGLDNKPGDRRSGFDLSYKIPKLRDRMQFYVEEFSEDEILPLFLPRRSAMHPGIYFSKLPKLPRVDLRVEGIYTDIPGFGINEAPGFFYFNNTWRSGFTQNGNLMGSWIGREGRGISSTSRVWLSPRNTIKLGYREGVADKDFILGGRYQDVSIQTDLFYKSHLGVSAMLQYENWRFPALALGLQRNLTSSVQLTYSPSSSH